MDVHQSQPLPAAAPSPAARSRARRRHPSWTVSVATGGWKSAGILGSFDRSQDETEAQVHQVDVGNGDGNIAGKNDAMVDHAIQQLQQGNVFVGSDGVGHDVSCATLLTKLYSGQGPVTSTSRPG